MMKNRMSILLVDDEPDLVQTLLDVLKLKGYEVEPGRTLYRKRSVFRSATVTMPGGVFDTLETGFSLG